MLTTNSWLNPNLKQIKEMGQVKDLLISALTIAIGYAVGTMVYNKFLGGSSSMEMSIPGISSTEEEEAE